MNNTKDDKYYVSKILEDIERVQQYTNKINSYEEFEKDEVIIDAVLFRMVQIAENIKKLSAAFKDSHKDVQWAQIVGFRNGIVHDYGRTDYSIVYAVVTKDIIDLKEALLAQKNTKN